MSMAGTDDYKQSYEACLENAETWLNEGKML